MESIFNKPILEQMYEFRMEDFEQEIYKKNDEIREIEGKICELGDKFLDILKTALPNEEDYQKALELMREYELSFGCEMSFWSKQYYKLGMNDMYKLRRELKQGIKAFEDNSTFLDYTDAELTEYIQEKLDFKSEKYKKFSKMYDEINEKYPRVIKVFEDSTPIVLNEEEMKALMQLKEQDTLLRDDEDKLCFKLGIKEMLNL